MRAHEALAYLPALGISPTDRCICAMPGCNIKFTAAHGVAFPGQASGQNQVNMFLMCSEECYLEGVPVSMLPRC